jgi:wyosine [tRNA(Phe)-imidazoG37] synthetase (radical SAM superfamily)
VEYLIAYEGHEFAFTGQVEEDLLSITSVHPMRRDAVEEFLSKAEEDWSVVERLLEEGLLSEIEYSGATFYLRRFR